MKKCIYCKKSIDDHFRICPYCGENQEYTAAIPVIEKSYVPPVPEERKVTANFKRPKYYMFIVFLLLSILLSGFAFFFSKPDLVALLLIFASSYLSQVLFALVAFLISHFAFSQERNIQEFMDQIGDALIPAILIGVLLLLTILFAPRSLLVIFFILFVSCIVSGSLSVLLGPAKRIYAALALFIFLILLLLYSMSHWYGVMITFS